jgi:hypothetical protein
MISAMKKKKSGIYEDALSIFEGILQKQREEPGCNPLRTECWLMQTCHP